MMFKLKNILGTQGLTKDNITTILDTVDSFKEISTRPIKRSPRYEEKPLLIYFLNQAPELVHHLKLRENG